MQHIEKEVREYLRAGDILIARLKTEKELTAEEFRYLESYTARIMSLMQFCATGNTSETIETTTDSPHITVRVSRDKPNSSP
jgi:hypothetical protein